MMSQEAHQPRSHSLEGRVSSESVHIPNRDRQMIYVFEIVAPDLARFKGAYLIFDLGL
jgi:hypothetical protein